MDPSLRIVVRMPINELWLPEGSLAATKIRSLTSKDIAELLRHGLIRFIVAECGDPLQWIPPPQCYAFWKTEVKPRIVETEIIYLEEFPGSYCYVASEWTDDQPSPIVLLEMYH